ncbi:ATP-binding protein [Cloacibacillus evryensis]|uniref:ATP-binding protein n=1 Tax=Cloacibacillus evryensis TaxID=508460 RepID=UPI00267374B0|nr:ATP-binding protein [Cloacibacillus evryensis]
MLEADLIQVLDDLIEKFEYELVEFKEAGKDFDKDKIGQYFSAISNEANLKGSQYGWLIFGVRDRDRAVIGSNYRSTLGLDALKQEISQGTNGGVTFIDIFEIYPLVNGERKRVIMFKIPAAITAMPTTWKGHFYGRNGESLVSLSMEEIERIRRQEKIDWSKQVIMNSSIAHLDSDAIKLARKNILEKSAKEHILQELKNMSDEELLTKYRLIVDGNLTNAAMVLLGSEKYDYLIERPPQVVWRLYGAKGNDLGYEIFNIPFITAGERVYAKIRNLSYRYMPNQKTLFPVETQQYEQSVFYELINNCIAHQDYSMGARIYVNEFEDKIKFTNPGTFLPQDVRSVLSPSYSPPFYRNQLLASAMAAFGMIDSMSMGIRNVFNILRKKYFPMPDYNFEQNQVSVTIFGRIIDLDYTRLLFDNPDFDLSTVYLIDRVQKNEALSKEQIKYLRKLKVVEGKSPRIYLSAKVAETIEDQTQYIKNKGFDDKYYKKLIVEYITQFGAASKQDIRKLLLSKLPDVLSEQQKEHKVKNLLTSLRKEGAIQLDSPIPQTSRWVIKK